MTPQDLDALEKLADAFDSGAYSTSGAMARTYGAGGKIRAAQDIKALIAELKEARGLLQRWRSDLPTEALEDLTDAFLVRNGKGEEPHTPRNATRGLSDEC